VTTTILPNRTALELVVFCAYDDTGLGSVALIDEPLLAWNVAVDPPLPVVIDSASLPAAPPDTTPVVSPQWLFVALVDLKKNDPTGFNIGLKWRVDVRTPDSGFCRQFWRLPRLARHQQRRRARSRRIAANDVGLDHRVSALGGQSGMKKSPAGKGPGGAVINHRPAQSSMRAETLSALGAVGHGQGATLRKSAKTA
jgi:hypothetical protein